MPTYEFKCGDCGDRTFPILPVNKRDTPQMCTWCYKPMERQPAAPGFALKGAGFYVNDHPKPRATTETD